MKLNGFNADDYQGQDFTPLPDGKYLAKIIASDSQATKAGDGQMLVLQFEIIDGEHRGRRIWDRLCIEHKNADAQRIARERLADICRAVGKTRLHDSQELHGLPLVVTVKVVKRKDNDDLVNEIKGYAARGQQSAAAPKPAAPAKPATTAAPKAAPWAKPAAKAPPAPPPPEPENEEPQDDGAQDASAEGDSLQY